MLDREITFDRVMRWLIVALVATAIVLLINRLSSVLLPFFIAWILAYMIYPFVLFLQNKCRLKYRILSIVVALFVALYNRIFSVTFDEAFAKATGVATSRYNLVIAVMISPSCRSEFAAPPPSMISAT